jgi:Ligand-gated ion channel
LHAVFNASHSILFANLIPVNVNVQSLSARVLVSAYWLFIVLMLATFTSNLAALLTGQ